MQFRKEILLGMFLFFVAGQARAEDCGLKRYVSLDLPENPSGPPNVRVQMDGQQGLMMVDTGGAFSEITSEAVDRLNLETRPIGNRKHIYAGDTGDRIDREVSVSDFRMGDLDVGKWIMMVGPKDQPDRNPRFLGSIGPDILRHFDLDFDFAARKFSLISQDHCPGKVVYWSQAYTSVPFDFDQTGHIRVKVTVDGQELDAILDTGAKFTSMHEPPAARWFGITADSPNIVAPEKDTLGMPSFHLHSLTLSGVTVENPQFLLIPDKIKKSMDKQFGPFSREIETPIAVGMDVLKQLHLYVAYGEEKLYVTAADTH